MIRTVSIQFSDFVTNYTYLIEADNAFKIEVGDEIKLSRVSEKWHKIVRVDEPLSPNLRYKRAEEWRVVQPPAEVTITVPRGSLVFNESMRDAGGQPMRAEDLV